MPGGLAISSMSHGSPRRLRLARRHLIRAWVTVRTSHSSRQACCRCSTVRFTSCSTFSPSERLGATYRPACREHQRPQAQDQADSGARLQDGLILCAPAVRIGVVVLTTCRSDLKALDSAPVHGTVK